MKRDRPNIAPGWKPVIAGLPIGLFAARLIIEATRMPWPPVAILALTLVSCAAFVGVERWLERRRAAPPAATLVLLIYALWPQRDGHVAAIVAAIALLAWFIPAITQHLSRLTFDASRFSLTDTLTCIFSFLIYLATLQKDILPADSGEFQLTVTTLAGVLHQPGYPLYTLVGKLFTLLPLGSPALGLNLMSALLAAGTLTLAGAAVRKLLDDPAGATWGSLAAVLALGTSTTF